MVIEEQALWIVGALALLTWVGLGWGLWCIAKRQEESIVARVSQSERLESLLTSYFSASEKRWSGVLARMDRLLERLAEGKSNEVAPGRSPAHGAIQASVPKAGDHVPLAASSPDRAASVPDLVLVDAPEAKVPEPKVGIPADPTPPPMPMQYPAQRGDAQKRLEGLLHDDAFRKDCWPSLYGPFDACAYRLEQHLAARNVGSILVSSSPRVEAADSRHWRFLVVQVRGESRQDRIRFLIPGYYSRYDAAWFDYLFESHGDERPGEKFVVGLSRCAQLEGGGDLDGTISAVLVRTKGRISVGE